MIPCTEIQHLDDRCYAAVPNPMYRKLRFRRCMHQGRYRLQAADGQQFLVCGSHIKTTETRGEWLWRKPVFDWYLPSNVRRVEAEELAALMAGL